jgi:transposase
MREIDAYIEQLKDQPHLAALLAPLFDLIEQQAQRIQALEDEVATLRARLQQNSTNSHKPPASDGLRKAPALPKAQGGKSGGQPGHRGQTLKMVQAPHQIDHARPADCAHCGTALQAVVAEHTERRQVFDLPVPRLLVREYQREVCRCPSCGARNQIPFPEAVTAPVQYGAGVVALSTLLHNDYHVPVAKVSRLFGDLFGYALNEATIQAANRRTAAALAPSQAAIEAQIAQAQVTHADETGLRCAGRLNWLHVLSTPSLSTYFVHPKRGRLALESSSSVLGRFAGCLVHDCWSSYFGVHSGRHGLCNAHLIRELRALAEQGALWAGTLVEVLLEGHRYKTAQGVVPPAVYRGLKQRYFALLRQGLATHPMPVQQPGRGRRKRGKARSLIRRPGPVSRGGVAFCPRRGSPLYQ